MEIYNIPIFAGGWRSVLTNHGGSSEYFDAAAANRGRHSLCFCKNVNSISKIWELLHYDPK